MRSSIGTNFCLTLFGESHGEAIGFVLDGLPPASGWTCAVCAANLSAANRTAARHAAP